MHRSILIPLLFLFIATAYSQELNSVVYDEEAEEEILLGYCDIDGLMKEPFVSWFRAGQENYETDEPVLEGFDSKKLENIHIIAIIATWSRDTKRELPRFIKVLEQLDFNMHRLAMIGVDRSKENAGEFDISKLDIEYVPTFIIYEGKEELGRITEKPEESIEKDIVNILSN